MPFSTSLIPFLNSATPLPILRAISGNRPPKIKTAMTKMTIHSPPPGRPKNANMECAMRGVSFLPIFNNDRRDRWPSQFNWRGLKYVGRICDSVRKSKLKRQPGCGPCLWGGLEMVISLRKYSIDEVWRTPMRESLTHHKLTNWASMGMSGHSEWHRERRLSLSAAPAVEHFAR